MRVVGNSVLNGLDEKLLSRIRIIKVRPFSGAMISDMYNHLNLILRHNPDYIILHVGTNDASRNTANELLNKMLVLKSFVD